MKDYVDQLIIESRNNVNHSAVHVRKSICGGRCLEELKKKSKEPVYDWPWKDFDVRETGIWTTIVCKECGYSNFWSCDEDDGSMFKD